MKPAMKSQAIPTKRFRFTLRSLLAAMTALCVLLGMVTAVYRRQAVKWQERRAQSAIFPYGGVYSMASALDSIRTGGRSRGWFFRTFLNHVEAVDLSPHNWSATERRGRTRAVDDEALAVLSKFRKLRSLNLRDTRITDEGLQHLRALKRLEQLDLRGTQVTDVGLQKLQAALPDCKIHR